MTKEVFLQILLPVIIGGISIAAVIYIVLLFRKIVIFDAELTFHDAFVYERNKKREKGKSKE